MKNGGLCSLIIMILFSLSLAVIENQTPISVTRRLSGDLYTNFNGSIHENCPDDNHTFLVSERICVKDQELISGMYY